MKPKTEITAGPALEQRSPPAMTGLGSGCVKTWEAPVSTQQ